jgi:hypothetical protein
MNLIPALHLTGDHLLGCLCPDRNYLPYWQMTVDAARRAEFEFRPHCTGHNVGRWWNALLRLETQTGFAIPTAIEAAMLANTWALCDNPTGILLEEPDPETPHSWYIHSYRETMLALGLLVRYRGSARAHQQGLRAIAQMRRASQDVACWDLSQCFPNPADAATLAGAGGVPTYTHGRAIEGLLCFYAATGEALALEEAERLADYHFAHTVNHDGSLAPGCGHHTHSYLNTLRGLLELATLQHDRVRLEVLYATFHRAVAALLTPSGFVTHDLGDRDARAGGDIASAGDIAHLALLLWEHFREPALLELAERLVRCRLLPAQVMAPMPVTPRREAVGDAWSDLPQRFVGAIGGAVGQVVGQSCVTDFTAAAVHSLLEVQQRAVVREDHTVRVNFHFDRDLPGVHTRCERSGNAARLTVRADAGLDLHIRVPGWTPVDSRQLFVNEQPVPSAPQESFLQIASTGRPTEVCLHYALPESYTEERWVDPGATQATVRFHWEGDEIRSVEPLGAYLAPFPKISPSFLRAE